MSASAVSEAIERDLAAAEAEPEPEPEPEAPAPEPEQPPAPVLMGEKELAALGKKIDAENDRHEKRLRELYGPMFDDYLPCPLCMTEGYLLPLPLDQRDPAQVAAVHQALGENDAPELLDDEGAVECDKCAGYGRVLTHSKRAEHHDRDCSHCAGRGFMEKAAIVQPYNYPPPALASANGTNPYPPVNGELDTWNRPAGHPHYGMPPALVT